MMQNVVKEVESEKEEKEILKLVQAKSQKVATDVYTQMRTLKTRLASSSLHLLMPEQRLRKLKESRNRMRERYKSLQSWSNVQK